jgi:hypothetical protein
VADNIPITAGSGTTVHTDDVGGVHDQYVKIEDGTLDSTNKLIVNAAGEMLVKLSTATATVPVSSASALDVSAATVTVNQSRPSTGTLTSVAASASSTQLLAANASRKDCALYNDSTSVVRIGLTAGAVSSTAFTVLLNANEYYEIPYGYTGRIAAIWASATGSMRITELT